jgi:hypothetical protein
MAEQTELAVDDADTAAEKWRLQGLQRDFNARVDRVLRTMPIQDAVLDGDSGGDSGIVRSAAAEPAVHAA